MGSGINTSVSVDGVAEHHSLVARADAVDRVPSPCCTSIATRVGLDW